MYPSPEIRVDRANAAPRTLILTLLLAIGAVQQAPCQNDIRPPVVYSAVRVGQWFEKIGSYPVGGIGAGNPVNTWIPFSFDLPAEPGLIVHEAWIEAQIQGIDANGDGKWDDLPSTDALLMVDLNGDWRGGSTYFPSLYPSGARPNYTVLLKEPIDVTRTSLTQILTDGGKLDAVIQDDTSVMSVPTLHIVFASPPGIFPPPPYTFNPMVDCIFPPLPAFPARGPIAAIGATTGETMDCTVNFTATVDWTKTTDNQFTTEITNHLDTGVVHQPGFDTSNLAWAGTPAPNGIASVYNAPVATGDGFTLTQNAYASRPPAGSPTSINYNYTFTYRLALNEDSYWIQDGVPIPSTTVPEQAITIAGSTTTGGSPVLFNRHIVMPVQPVVPRITLENMLNSSTAVAGDMRKVSVWVRNDGTAPLRDGVRVVARVPAGALYDPGSASITPTSVTPLAGGGQDIEWVGPFGGIPAGSHSILSYWIQIQEAPVEGTELSIVSYASGIAENPCRGTTRQVSGESPAKILTISPITVGIGVELGSLTTTGCFGSIISYTAQITNTGHYGLENVTATLLQGARPYGTNPLPLSWSTLAAGETKSFSYFGDIGTRERGVLTDVVIVSGDPYNGGIQIAPQVSDIDTTAFTVMKPGIIGIAPASMMPGDTNVELIISGHCFAPGALPEFYDLGGTQMPGIALVPPTAPAYGWVSTNELRFRVNVAADTPTGIVRVAVINPNGDGGTGIPPDNEFTIGALTPPDITVSPASLAFGEVQVGESKSVDVTIGNTGQSTLQVSSVSIGGTAGFTIDPTSFSVASGEEQIVTVTFTPTSEGQVSPTLTITSNDPDEGSVGVGIAATAIPPQVDRGEAELSLVSLSVRFQDATAEVDGSPVTLKLTLTDSGEGYNGELANSLLPEDPSELLEIGGGGEYYSHFSIVEVLDSDDFPIFFGFIELDVPPVVDSNSDGLPDFFDPDLAQASVTTSGVYEDFYFGDTGSVSAVWSRPAGQAAGTCVLTVASSPTALPEDVTFDATFEIVTYTGTLAYDRLDDTSQGTLDLEVSPSAGMDVDSVLTGPMNFARTSDDILDIDDGTLTGDSSQDRPFMATYADRHGDAFLGTLEMDWVTGKAGYYSWAVRIGNNGDQDQDGVPDLSDGDSGFTEENFESWKQRAFGPDASDPLIAGESADPDKDGRSNLLEFGTGNNPLSAINDRLPSLQIGPSTFEVSFPINPIATGIEFSVEAGPLGGAWTAKARRPVGGTWSSLDPEVSVSDGTNKVSLSLPRNAAAEFSRLKVMKP